MTDSASTAILCWLCERPNPHGNGDDPCRRCEDEWDENPMVFVLDAEGSDDA